MRAVIAMMRLRVSLRIARRRELSIASPFLLSTAVVAATVPSHFARMTDELCLSAASRNNPWRFCRGNGVQLPWPNELISPRTLRGPDGHGRNHGPRAQARAPDGNPRGFRHQRACVPREEGPLRHRCRLRRAPHGEGEGLRPRDLPPPHGRQLAGELPENPTEAGPPPPPGGERGGGERPETLRAHLPPNPKIAYAISVLNRLPELQKAMTKIVVRLGREDNPLGKWVVIHGAGTNGGDPVAQAAYDHGIDTVFY